MFDDDLYDFYSFGAWIIDQFSESDYALASSSDW